MTKLIYLLISVLTFTHTVTISMQESTDKAIKKFYEACKSPFSVQEDLCPGCTRKWCAGLFDAHCITSNSCTFAGAVSENETHFKFFMLENTADYKINDTESYSQVAMVSPFLPLHLPGSPFCKSKLTMSDFKFRYFRNVDRRLGTEKGVMSGQMYKSNWTVDCQDYKRRYLVDNYLDLKINISGEYFTSLFSSVSQRAEKSPDFSDGTKYNTTDGFLYLNFDTSFAVAFRAELTMTMLCFLSAVIYQHF